MTEDPGTASLLKEWLEDSERSAASAQATNETDLKVAALKAAVAIVLKYGPEGENPLDGARLAVNRLTRSFLKALGPDSE